MLGMFEDGHPRQYGLWSAVDCVNVLFIPAIFLRHKGLKYRDPDNYRVRNTEFVDEQDGKVRPKLWNHACFTPVSASMRIPHLA